MATIDRTKETTPPTVRLTLVRGDSFSHTIRIKKASYDFTGTTARAYIKDKRRITLLLSVVPELVFPAVGEMLATLKINYAQTTWEPGLVFGDLELTFLGGIRKTVAFLEIQVIADVTAP